MEILDFASAVRLSSHDCHWTLHLVAHPRALDDILRAQLRDALDQILHGAGRESGKRIAPLLTSCGAGRL